jgi:hypothetical protein
MSSSSDHCPACGQAAPAATSNAALRERGFWPSIVRIAALEIALLIATAGVFIAYLNWSSEASFAEFLAATQTQEAPSVPVSEVRSPCKRGA